MASHGARVSVCGPPCNATHLDHHIDKYGEASACVIIKYAYQKIQDHCRMRGMLAVLDSVDNHRAFDPNMIANDQYGSADAILVQTSRHAHWLAAAGLRAVVVPHPHGNLNAWGVSRGVRERVSGVGLLVGDAWRNLPKAYLEALSSACCANNATLYVVYSQPDRPVRFQSLPCPNATEQQRLLLREHARWRLAAPARRQGWIHSCESESAAVLQEACAAAESTAPAGMMVSRTLATAFADGSRSRSRTLIDTTRQQMYYDAPRLHELIDVALVWSPGNQLGNAFAVQNRPPTRMNWWWSHGVPVVGYPMEAYVEASERAGYPATLLNLSRSIDVQRALCSIADPRTRSCLRTSALRGAAITSPQYSAQELLAALCAVAESCSDGGVLRQTKWPKEELPLETEPKKGRG